MKRDLTRAIRAVLSFSIPAMAIAAILALPARANPVLQITELSDTELTVTLDGVSYGTVTNTGPDRWQWRSGFFGDIQGYTQGVGVFYDSLVGGFWAEPSDASKVNFVGLAGGPKMSPTGYMLEMGLNIYSDVDLSAIWNIFGSDPFVDGAPGMVGYYGGIAHGPVLFGPFDVYFTDKGDAAKVPDSSTTFALLALAGVTMAAFAKRRV